MTSATNAARTIATLRKRIVELEQSNKTIIKEDGVVVSRQTKRIRELEKALSDIGAMYQDGYSAKQCSDLARRVLRD